MLAGNLFLFMISVSSLCECVLLGGRVAINLSDSTELERISHLAAFGVKSISAKRLNTTNNNATTKEMTTGYSLLNITSAYRQLDAGINYYITVEMQLQNCSNDDDTTPCELKREECELTILEQVWRNYTELIRFECITAARRGPGARVKIANEDTNARQALEYAIVEMNKLSDQPVYYVPVVQNTYKQIVNGVKYTFEFEYAPSDCLIQQENMSEFKSDACKVDETKETMSCVVSVWDKFWLADHNENDNGRYEITLTNCA